MQGFDLLGKKYGSWTIIGKIPREKGKSGPIYWICECKCGTRIKRGSSHIIKNWNATDCGCSRQMIGKKFGSLTIIERLGKDSKFQSNYLCRCDCGKEKIYRGNYVLYGTVKTCGCGRRHNTKQNGQKIVWYTYRKNAKKRQLVFELCHDKFIELIEKECFYCGERETNKTYAYKRCDENEIYRHNGIDRIDSNKGYTIENSVPCCKLCNHMKWDLSVKEWYEHIKMVLENKGQ